MSYTVRHDQLTGKADAVINTETGSTTPIPADESQSSYQWRLFQNWQAKQTQPLSFTDWPQGFNQAMVPNYAALKAEITNDPLGLKYADKSPAAVADLLNTKSFSFFTKVPNASLRKWAAMGPRASLESVKTITPMNPAILSMALTALDILADGVTSLDLSDPTINSSSGQPGMIQYLKVMHILSDQDISSLLAMGSVAASRVEILFNTPGMEVNAQDIQAALTL